MKKNTIISFVIFALFYSTMGLSQEKPNSKLKLAIKKYTSSTDFQINKHVFSVLASNNQYPLILKDPSAFLQQNFTRGIDRYTVLDAVYLNYQYSLKHQFFSEFGFKYLKYFDGYRANPWLIQSGTTGFTQSVFSTLSFDFGFGYRIIVNNNLRLLDLHVGFTLAFTDSKVGSGRTEYYSGTYTDGMGNVGTNEIFYQYSITNRFSSGLYIGISKDVRLTENLYLTARYNNHFGRNSIISEHVFNYSLSTVGIVNEVKGNLTAKGQMYAVGLKWVFK